jgi:hypothetical protein
MQGFAQVLTITIKELREIVSRPWQALTLILGPLALMVGFGIGSDATARPPSAIVVVPPGQAQPRLLRDYQRQFESFLDITEYTDDEAYARRQLRRNAVDAIVLLPRRRSRRSLAAVRRLSGCCTTRSTRSGAGSCPTSPR